MKTNPPSSTRHGTSTGLVTLLFSLLYFTSYITRKSFGAVKLGLPTELLNDEQIGLIGSALFFAYGAGQLISGVLGDRIDPRRLILWGLGATAVCNAAFPLITSFPVLVVLWAVNGFAQAMFWPPLVKLMSIYLKGDDYTTANMYVSMSSQASLLTVFGIATLVVHWGVWQGSFVVAVVFAFVTMLALIWGFRTLERRHPGAVDAAMQQKKQQKQECAAKAPSSAGLWGIIAASGLLFSFCVTATVGFLRDGLEEWLSSYLQDTFSLASDFSTLLNILMPVFTLVCIRLTAMLYTKVFHDEVLQTVITMGIATLALLALVLFKQSQLLLTVVILMIAVGCIHSSNVCFTSYLPRSYTATGKVSTIAGLVNAFTYVGSTVATSALPRIAGRASWDAALLTCAAVAAMALLCAALMHRKWRRWSDENREI